MVSLQHTVFMGIPFGQHTTDSIHGNSFWSGYNTQCSWKFPLLRMLQTVFTGIPSDRDTTVFTGIRFGQPTTVFTGIPSAQPTTDSAHGNSLCSAHNRQCSREFPLLSPQLTVFTGIPFAQPTTDMFTGIPFGHNTTDSVHGNSLCSAHN